MRLVFDGFGAAYSGVHFYIPFMLLSTGCLEINMPRGLLMLGLAGAQMRLHARYKNLPAG